MPLTRDVDLVHDLNDAEAFPEGIRSMFCALLTSSLAVAYLVASHLAADAAVLRSHWCRPFILCGQFSLQIFCLGAILVCDLIGLRLRDG